MKFTDAQKDIIWDEVCDSEEAIDLWNQIVSDSDKKIHLNDSDAWNCIYDDSVYEALHLISEHYISLEDKYVMFDCNSKSGNTLESFISQDEFFEELEKQPAEPLQLLNDYGFKSCVDVNQTLLDVAASLENIVQAACSMNINEIKNILRSKIYDLHNLREYLQAIQED